MLRTPSVLVSNKALGLSLHASQGFYLINFRGISSEKISDIILCPHSGHKARPRLDTQHIFYPAGCHQDYFLASQHFNIFIIIALVWSGPGWWAPVRSVSVKTPLGSPRDNEMETVSLLLGFTMNQINILTN